MVSRMDTAGRSAIASSDGAGLPSGAASVAGGRVEATRIVGQIMSPILVHGVARTLGSVVAAAKDSPLEPCLYKYPFLLRC